MIFSPMLSDRPHLSPVDHFPEPLEPLRREALKTMTDPGSRPGYL